MYSSKFAQVSFLNMSNSERFLVKEAKEEVVEYDILMGRSSSPPLELQDPDHQPDHQEQEKVQQHDEEDCKCHDHLMIIKASSYNDHHPHHHQEDATQTLTADHHQPKVEDDDDDDDDNDGFKTPTSLDHKIPVIKQCPPAPRKPKPLPSTTKRKLSSSGLYLDVSREIESMFPIPILADLQFCKIKKPRRGDPKD